MKKRWISLAVTLVLISTFLTGCGGEETYHNIAAQSNPYSMGEQSIELIANSANANEPVVKFKSSVSPDDIELGQALEGKTVTKVNYNSETSITVVLDGSTKVTGGDGVYGTITVRHSGLESKGRSTCVVNVRVPEIKVSALTSSQKTDGDVTTYNMTSKLSLITGEFTDEATANGITFGEGVTGELSAERSDDGLLVVTIRNCSTAKPSICLKAEATTFGKDITVVLSVGGSAKIQ